ncbi:MAG: alpha/beta fold hydrolase, partial [Deltaproteobacteria bacterium]|nr:alpha/beta fold hydrolase [Deltaproteobacteria bacterium]
DERPRAGRSSTSTSRASPATKSSTDRRERQSARSARPLGRVEDVTFPSNDGLTVHATLHRGPSSDTPAVVLVHQLGRDRREWDALVERLHAGARLTVLAIDLRGHGASTRRADGRAIEWARMATDDWRAIEGDVLAAVAFVRPGGRAGLAAPRVAIVGSSIGSSAAIRAAVQDPAIVAVAALSPGRAYRGVDAIEPLRRWGSRRLWILATSRDAASAEAAHDMLRVVSRSDGRIVDGRAHGLAMTTEVPGLLDAITAFVRDALGVP